jgi:hypothetical protein
MADFLGKEHGGGSLLREAYGVRPACRRFFGGGTCDKFVHPSAFESGSKLLALHTLRANVCHRGNLTLSNDAGQWRAATDNQMQTGARSARPLKPG